MFYYLEWLEKRPSKVLITKEKPKLINYSVDFKVKNEIYTLCGNINKGFEDYIFLNETLYTKNQYLLSHLQKSIRRMKTEISVKTAKHLINLDLNSFIRRLPIIMLEDVTIHESFPIIIWLMIAISKKYKIKKIMIQWLLGIVYYLSMCNVKTNYEKENYINEYTNDNNNYTLLQSLNIRIAYGGMNGDMDMIRYFMNHIINKDIKIEYSNIPIIKLDIEDLQKNEWIYQSNDFHCNRYIIKQVKDYFPEYTEEYIKELIWNCSSCKNNRIEFKINKKYHNDWVKIKQRVKIVQKSCNYH
tara:strand:+ start:18 stop:917 length:900 start_codon:yes stop_codon:yes gene_type:complete